MGSGLRSYLDHNATSPARPEVITAVARALELPGNPSSIHQEGRAARALLEQARDRLAALVGASPRPRMRCCLGRSARQGSLPRRGC